MNQDFKSQKSTSLLGDRKRSFFSVGQKILLSVLGVALLLFLTLSLLLRGTPKPAFLSQNEISGEPSLLSRLSGLEEKVARQTQRDTPFITFSPAFPAFLLLRQDILAGLPPSGAIERLRNALSGLELPQFTSELDFLAQQRIPSAAELMGRFDPTSFFVTSQKKGFFRRSLSFFERFFTIKQTATPEEMEKQEALKATFCANVKAADFAKLVLLEEELSFLLETAGKEWLEDVHRFLKAQEILLLIEKNILH